MDFARMSDGIRLFHRSHHDGHDDHGAQFPVSAASRFSMIDPFDHGGLAIGREPGSGVNAADPSFHMRMAESADRPG